MGKRNRRRLTRQILGRIPSRIPGQALVPFLLFWCLGSFALGQELARLPLTAFAAVHPLQSALHAQGALGHALPAPHAHQVATGLLGGKPATPAVQKTSRKTTHDKTKQTSHAGSAIYRSSTNPPDLWGSIVPDASGPWDSRAQWAVQSAWTMRAEWVRASWNAQWAMDASTRWSAPDYVATPWAQWAAGTRSVASGDDGW